MPSPERGLCVLLHAPREQHEPIVRELIAPVARELCPSPDLDALFFARHDAPDWHLRLDVRGAPGRVEGPARDLLERRLRELRDRGGLAGFDFVPCAREVDRLGGEEGARLAERIFHHDTLACLAWIEAEAEGLATKSRREYCLIMTERFLDLLRLTREQRAAFYSHSYSFQVDLGRWGSRELDALERHYRSIRDALRDLFHGAPSKDPEVLWGGAQPARIARTCLDAQGPLVDDLVSGLAAGRIGRDLIDLAWSLTHMHANRLQVEAEGEAILRFLMHRLHQEEDIVAARPEGGRP